MILYVRLGCHLCDEALQQLAEFGIAVQRVNIDRDPDLQRQYDVLVPVLYDPARDQEWVYPFSEQTLIALSQQP